MWDLTYALAEEIGDPDLFDELRELAKDDRHVESDVRLGEETAAALAAAGILIVDVNKLAGYEMPSGL